MKGQKKMDSTIRKLEPESLSEVNGGATFGVYNVAYYPILINGGWPIGPPPDDWGYPSVDPFDFFVKLGF